MDRDRLAALCREGLSQREIAARLGVSQTTVRHWLRKHGFQTSTGVRDEGWKRCGSCRRERRIDHFAIRRRATGLRQSWCRDCRRAYDKARYGRGERGRGREKSRLLRERNRRFVFAYLVGRSCMDCGEDDLRVLEFDHVSGVKEFCISDAVRLAYGLKRIEEEMAKCEVVCSNCHRRRTLERLDAHRCRAFRNAPPRTSSSSPNRG